MKFCFMGQSDHSSNYSERNSDHRSNCGASNSGHIANNARRYVGGRGFRRHLRDVHGPRIHCKHCGSDFSIHRYYDLQIHESKCQCDLGQWFPVRLLILALDIAHINAYINDIHINDQSWNKPAFTSVALPLHSTVNQKLKEKIWANEYVELSTVLNDDIRLTSKISDFFPISVVRSTT